MRDHDFVGPAAGVRPDVDRPNAPACRHAPPRSSGIPAATSRHDNSSIHSCGSRPGAADEPFDDRLDPRQGRALIWLPLSLTDPRIPGARHRRPHGRIRVALDRGRHKHQETDRRDRAEGLSRTADRTENAGRPNPARQRRIDRRPARGPLRYFTPQMSDLLLGDSLIGVLNDLFDLEAGAGCPEPVVGISLLADGDSN